jgi:serine/threonine-protein kinase
VGRYSLIEELGRGGMGIVYLAHEVALDRSVALKLLPPEYAAQPALKERFLREAKTAARLSHPNIVPIYAVDEVDDFVFFAMAYVEGETLGERVSNRGPALEPSRPRPAGDGLGAGVRARTGCGAPRREARQHPARGG